MLQASVAITSITRTGSLINSITVGTEVYTADNLSTGTSSGGGPITGNPITVVDDLDLSTAAGRDRNFAHWQTINFNGGLYQDYNGDGYDFFIFERGGNDVLTVAAIFENPISGGPDIIGQTVVLIGDNLIGWGNTGYTDGQLAHGAAFKITELLDAAGVLLTNTSVIKGIRFGIDDVPTANSQNGIDPSVVVAVIPEPSSIGLAGLAVALLAARRTRKSS